MSGERWTINDERSIFALLGSARRCFQSEAEKEHSTLNRSSLNPHRSPPPLNILMNINDKKSEIIGA